MKRFAILLAVLALFAAGCSQSSASANKDGMRNVKLMLDWTPNTNHNGIYLAQQRGYYKEAGLNVEIIQPGDQGGLQPLASGNVDFAISVQESLLPAQEQGLPIISIAALLSTNTSSFLSLASENITRPKDLEGKKYGGYGGQLEKQLIDALVRCDNGDPSKISFVDVGNVDFRVGLENNNYDFVWVYEGWDTIRFKQANVAVNTLPFSRYLDCIPDWYTPLLATSKKHISEDRDLVNAFVNATAHGYRDAIADPDAAAKALLAGAPELDEKLVQESSKFLANYYSAPNTPWGTQSKVSWTRFDAFLHSAGMLQKPSNVDSAFTNEFLPAS